MTLSRGRRLLEVLALSAAGGVVSAVAVRYPAAGPLLALGSVLLMTPAIVDRWRSPVLGYLPGQFGWEMVLHWPMRSFGWFVPVILVPLLSWHFVLQALLAAWLRRATRWPAAVVLPLAVAAGEWTRAWLGVGNFNMYQVGTFLYDYPRLMQAADVVGGLGLSALWTMPFAALVDLAERRPSAWRWLTAGVAIAVLLLAYGSYRLGTPDFRPGPRVAIVQPSLEHSLELTPEVLRQQAQMTVAQIPEGAADVIVWPENAITDDLNARPEYMEAVRWVAASRKAPLLFGAQGLGPDGRRPTCSAYLVDGGGRTLGRYDKVVLFPFTERRALPMLERWWPWLGGQITALTRAAWRTAPRGWAAEEPGVITLPASEGRQDATVIWTPICYESCYPELARHAYALGARLFINISSEGWLGWAASNNQMGVNILRAVENRVGLVRVGNTGPSAFVLPDGRVDAYLRGETGRLRLTAGTLIRTVTLDGRGPTFYSRFGGLLDPLWFTVVVIAIISGALLRRRHRDSPPARARGRDQDWQEPSLGNGATQDGRPHDGAPQDGAPQDGTPQDGTPQDHVPQEPAPRAAARDAAPGTVAAP